MAYEVSRVVFTCPNGALVGDAVYISGAGTVSYADVDDPTKYSQTLIMEKITATTCILSKRNIILGGFVGLTAGDTYYLTGTATAGNTMSTTESAWEIGTAITTTQLYITNKIGIVYDDIHLAAIEGALAGVSNPTFGAFPAGEETRTYLFDKAASNELFFTAHIPHTYKEGTNVSFHLHWSPVDVDTGFVRWGADYSWTNMGGTVQNNTVITEDDAGDGTANKLQIVDLGPISGTGKEVCSCINIRLYRDGGNDTYDNDAALMAITIHFQKDTRGSNAEIDK